MKSYLGFYCLWEVDSKIASKSTPSRHEHALYIETVTLNEFDYCWILLYSTEDLERESIQVGLTL